jgi:hypothetical protein
MVTTPPAHRPVRLLSNPAQPQQCTGLCATWACARANQRAPCGLDRFEPPHRMRDALDRPMVSLHHMIERAHLPDADVPCASWSPRMAEALASRPSTVIVSGPPLLRIASTRKRKAAARSRGAVIRQSMVCPA